MGNGGRDMGGRAMLQSIGLIRGDQERKKRSGFYSRSGSFSRSTAKADLPPMFKT